MLKYTTPTATKGLLSAALSGSSFDVEVRYDNYVYYDSYDYDDYDYHLGFLVGPSPDERSQRARRAIHTVANRHKQTEPSLQANGGVSPDSSSRVLQHRMKNPTK